MRFVGPPPRLPVPFLLTSRYVERSHVLLAGEQYNFPTRQQRLTLLIPCQLPLVYHHFELSRNDFGSYTLLTRNRQMTQQRLQLRRHRLIPDQLPRAYHHFLQLQSGLLQFTRTSRR